MRRPVLREDADCWRSPSGNRCWIIATTYDDGCFSLSAEWETPPSQEDVARLRSGGGIYRQRAPGWWPRSSRSRLAP